MTTGDSEADTVEMQGLWPDPAGFLTADPSPGCRDQWHGADGGKCPTCGWDPYRIAGAEPPMELLHTCVRCGWRGPDGAHTCKRRAPGPP